jgi:sugar lactone lactonase YvrE
LAVTVPASNSFTISPAAVTQLAFVAQPGNARAKHVIAPAVQVAAQDQFGNTNPSWTTNITLTLASNPGSSTLGGTTTATPANGTAVFNDLKVDKGGKGYQLLAASGALPTKQSAGFDVLALFVSNISGSTVGIFPSDAGNVGGGNIAPTDVIAGGGTGLAAPGGITLDTDGNLYAANVNSITVYAPGATGNASPIRTITAAAGVDLSNTFGVVVDNSGFLYVADGLAPGSILVYAPGADGAATPVRTITGGATQLSRPEGVALDAAGNLYVANHDNSTITVYAPGADGAVAPIATIPTAGSNLSSPSAIALDGVGNVYAANQGGSGSITIYAPLNSGSPLSLSATITGGSTGLSGPSGVALDGGLIYVGNGGSNSVTIYPVGTLGGNIAPSFLIQGGNTLLNGPFGVAF